LLFLQALLPRKHRWLLALSAGALAAQKSLAAGSFSNAFAA
jgi:hypothetical protein